MIENLIELLHIGKYSCVIMNKSEVHTFHRKGIADLFQHESAYLKGSVVADREVGLETAVLMVRGEVECVYADVISKSALKLLYQAKIRTEYLQKVDSIESGDKSFWYPLELNFHKKWSISKMFEAVQNLVKRNRLSVIPSGN